MQYRHIGNKGAVVFGAKTLAENSLSRRCLDPVVPNYQKFGRNPEFRIMIGIFSTLCIYILGLDIYGY